VEPDADRTREQLDGAVVMGRPEPARDDEQVVPQPLLEGGEQIARIVADDRDPRRIDAQPEQGRSEVRTISVVPVAADELGARRDDRRARATYDAGRQPVGVTKITCGFAPGTCTRWPRTAMRRFSGLEIVTQSLLPRIAAVGSPFETVPS
jgi:hypothetical protein